MTSKTSKTRPAYDAFVVDGAGEQVNWIKVGAGWIHEDGQGVNIMLTPGLAVSRKLVLRVPHPSQTDPLE